MVNYADFEYYQGTYYGTAIPEGSFLFYCRKASAFINRLTSGNIDDHNIPEEAKMATCAVADVMYKDDSGKDQVGREIASENNDGYSVSYVTSANLSIGTVEQRARKEASLYLGGTGLMYRGVR